ncbi:hypothetical protein BLA60_33405 [Actinophytocola xinjiangensis]|uniref:Uncharacterized protein n=1 Tax=Actinophytocola xinjiangensis TaxID=485602 RepID=A0A7Z1AWA3_9PSEU|nr:hypothetical protein [Actinophytocola xinjiangensis]OLF06227.1 hypothetical protein BLA60_33405 [Actinophytocola xinjiangensis]
MSHELSAAEVRAITRSAGPGSRFRIDASFSIVVHDLDALRSAARRAFDYGRFASEQERERAWSAIENDPARLLSQAVDFARLTEDVPGILGQSVEFVVRDETG